MTDQSPSAGYLAFPDFHTACLWYNLFGIPTPNTPPTSSPNEQSEEQDDADPSNDPSEDETPTEQTNSSLEEGENEEENPPSNGEEAEETTSEGGDLDEETADSTSASEETTSEETANFELSDPTENPPTIPGFRLSATENGTDFIREFSSWYDFVTCVRDTPAAWPQADRFSQEESKYKTDFTKTTSFGEAIKMALGAGWPEGRKLLRDLSALVAPQPAFVETWDFDVAGAFPSIPTYCAGDPACFITELNQEHKAARPVIRIDIGIDVSWLISTESIITRGVAALSFAETLNRLGYSTELRIVSATREGWTPNTKTLRASIVFKSAGQPLDLDRAAFAIAHPSVLRRFFFALAEQHSELYSDFKGSYGIPLHEPNDPTSNKPLGAIYIPGPTSNNETSETARLAVETAAKAAGFLDPTFSLRAA